MNLSEVLNVALPELPALRAKGYPALHPRLIAREQIEGGVPTVVAMISGSENIFRFTPQQWQLLQLFDGKRSYEEISRMFEEQAGVSYDADELREFASALDDDGFWQKRSLDLNVTATQKVAEQRQRRRKQKDLSLITFSTWDPDNYLTRLHGAMSFVYTKWFTFLTLGLFAAMVLIFINGWSEIWRDTLEYYTFTDKGGADLAEFWFLFCGIGFFHESAHGLTCKHFGGEVHRMGFMLVYLSPAFFCDVGEIYVYGGKWRRVAAIIAGIWTELMFCGVASVLWWALPAGNPVHDFAYKVMMITGVAVVLINLNPLIKLDGYYLFSELIGLPTIKERSTEYVSSWVKRHLFRLPVEVPYLRLRRRWLFAGYAILSGIYSYLILYFIVRLLYNVALHLSPQWAFVLPLFLAILILRSRLRSSVKFMKDFYLDKEQSLHAWWAPRKAWLAGMAIVVLIAPVWRETVSGRFVVEAVDHAVIRATVPGRIVSVFAEEGSPVTAGAPILQLRNLRLEEATDSAQADFQSAEAGLRTAQLAYSGLARAQSEHASQLKRYDSASAQMAALEIASPISGVMVTPRLSSHIGSFVAAGDELAEVDGVRNLRARIFVPEFQLRQIASGNPVSLKLESFFQPIHGRVGAILPVASTLASGLEEAQKYKGIAPASYYVVMVPFVNASGRVMPGMSGMAKIQVRRRSIAGLTWETIRNLIQRKVW
jgi:putative peptide zinc metalloprotease protein